MPKTERVGAILPVALALCCSCRDEASPEPPARCRAEVTAGEGTFGATARGARGHGERRVRQRALRAACERMCEARGEKSRLDACRARCLVDAEADKIGARVRCEGFASAE